MQPLLSIFALFRRQKRSGCTYVVGRHEPSLPLPEIAARVWLSVAANPADLQVAVLLDRHAAVVDRHVANHDVLRVVHEHRPADVLEAHVLPKEVRAVQDVHAGGRARVFVLVVCNGDTFFG